MKRTCAALFFVTYFALGIYQSTIAQSKEVNIADVRKMEQTAMTLLRSAPYRTIWTSWVFPERGKEHSYKTVMTNESDAAGRTRSIQENDNPGSFNRMEVISIGLKNYRKIDDGAWQILPPLPYGDPVISPPSPGSRPRFETRAKLVETLNGNDGIVSVYETVTKSTQEVDGKDVSQINTATYWFRYDGRLLRKDRELETVGERKMLKNSTVYEYDNIKIEAPIK